MASDKDRKDQPGPKKLLVLITSNDGHIKHPFDKTSSIGEVRDFAYDRLVKQKEQTPIDETWIEFNDSKQDQSTVLSLLAERDPGGGPDPDLTLSLVWGTGGGKNGS